MEEESVYGECMRNHAAKLGTYATDGCGEFAPDPASPSDLLCAACRCHRSFHRKLPPPLQHSPATADSTARRARTKFTPHQKERMLRFAEKIEWRIPRGTAGRDELGAFCREIGVGRHIFKVWMHNNRKGCGSSTSSPSTSTSTSTATAFAGGEPGDDDREE